MIDWIIVIIFGGLAIPSGIIGVQSTYEMIVRLSQKSGGKLPNKKVISIAAIIQNVVLASIMAIIGFSLQSTTKFELPFIKNISKGEFDIQILIDQVISVFIPTLLVTLLFLGLYYYYYRPSFSEELIGIIEGLRDRIGLLGRIFSGGIFEEILFRWGILSIFYWLLSFLFPNQTLAFWIANSISAIIFGAAHLPGVKGMGIDLNTKIIQSALVLNGVVGLLFGWALLNYGLEAAMFAHIFVHLVWYPIEKLKGKTRMSFEEAQSRLQ